MEWTQLYDRSERPGFTEIKNFLAPDAFMAYEEFTKILLEKYNLGYVVPRYTKDKGWVYSFGRSGFLCVYHVTFEKEAFLAENVRVCNMSQLPEAVRQVDRLFHEGFLERYAEFCQARTLRRQEKKQQREAISETEYKKNCIWCPKVSRNDLMRLYTKEAQGMLDEELLEEIGLTMYVRCKVSKEIYNLMEQGKIKCMECGSILSGSGELVCGCGRKYTCHAYRKAYRENNMPRGAASAIFDQFTADWENAAAPQEKMRLIDNLIHEFHVSEISGMKGRPVGVNLIQGTKPQIVKLICELAGS